MGERSKPDALIGQVVAGRYEVIRLLGKGGMGAVYEVVHKHLGRTFAMKKLAAELLEDTEALARFRREAEVVARFRHPNIVEVSDWETLADGSPCIIMEFLHGEDLAHRLRSSGPLTWPALVRIADQVMSALSVAHRGSIVHRDLKPQNIFLAIDDTGEESAKLLDFGVSKMRGLATGITTTNERLLGTPLYMSPEQAEGQAKSLGPETDVWAMGAILFEMATARQAFAAPSVPSVLYRICHGEPEPLQEIRRDAPPAFVDLVSRALSRDRRRRLLAIEDLRIGLHRALADVTPGFVPSRPISVPAVPARAAVPIQALPVPPGGTSSPLATTLSHAVGQSFDDAVPNKKRGTRTKRWLIGGSTIVAVGIATGVIAAIGANGDVPSASRTPPGDEPAALMGDAAVAPVSAPAPSGPTVAPMPRVVSVLVRSDPNARVYRGNEKMGTTPLSVDVTGATPVKLRLEARGHRPREITLHGSDDSVVVELERLEDAKRTVPGSTSGQGSTAGNAPPEPDESGTTDMKSPPPDAGYRRPKPTIQ